jgi:hypothetical protein
MLAYRNSHPCKINHVKGQNNSFADGLLRMLTTNKEQKNELDIQPAIFPIINTIDKEQQICNLINKVKSIHEDDAVCHPGTKSTLEHFRITQSVGKLETLVFTETIKHCIVCQRFKRTRQKNSGLFQKF